MNVPINIGGQSYDLTMPDGSPQDKIDARVKEVGGFQEKSWGDWAKQLLIPQTPAEWGIALATLPLGFGAGGVASRALTVAGRPLLAKLAGGMAGRVATLAAGGGIGALAGQAMSEEPDKTTSFGGGVAQGLIAGVAGEGAGALLRTGTNVMMRNFIRKVQNPEALAAFQKTLLPDWASTLQSKSPAESFAYVMSDIGKQTGGSVLGASIDRAAAVADTKGQWVGKTHQAELGRWLRDNGYGTVAGTENDMFTLREAMDGYMRIGPTNYREGFSPPGVKEGQKQFQAALLNKLYSDMGPDAAEVMQTGLHQFAAFKQWARFLKSTPDTFLPNGGLDFGPAQEATWKMFLGQDAKTLSARQKLGGDMTNKLVDTLWHGGQPMSGRDLQGGIGFSMGLHYPRVHGIRFPSFAGEPLQAPPGVRGAMGAALTIPAMNTFGGMVPSSLAGQ